MLALRCPSCGDVNAISLETPEAYECGACRWAGPPSEADRPIIDEASRVVAALDERSLQMSALQKDMLASATFGRATLLLALGVLVVPAVLTTGFVESLIGERRGSAPLVLLPSVTLLMATVAAVLVVRRRERRLLEQCTADPPRGQGELGRCHVCGAAVDGPAGAVVARCRFCRADNVVAPEAMQRVRRRHDLVADGFLRTLARKQATVGSVSRYAAAAIVAGALAVDAGVAWAALERVDERRAALAALGEHHVVLVDGRRCIARMRSATGGPRWDLGPLGQRAAAEVERVGTLDVRTLVTGRVRAGGSRGVVDDVQLEDGRLVLHFGEGGGVRVEEAVGACFEEAGGG